MIRPMFSGAKNSCAGTVPETTPKKRLVACFLVSEIVPSSDLRG